jgi:hypothetical protein
MIRVEEAMAHWLHCGCIGALLGLLAAPAHALPSIALSGEIGTLGLGAQAGFKLMPWVNVRGSVQGLQFNHAISKDNTDYDGSFRLLSYGALLDVYPFTRGPRLSVGIFGNGNRLDIDAGCATSCTANDLTIEGANASLAGSVRFASSAPYAGLGWGNAMAGGPFFFSADLGVMFQGSPKVSLGASGTATVTDGSGNSRSDVNLAADPQVQSQVEAEQSNLAGQLHSYSYYPVLMLSAGWRF